MPGSDVRVPTVSYPDIAVPANTTLDIKHSVIIGEGKNWTGKLLASSELSETDAANHVLRQMQSKGWQLLSSVHADKSTYFFSNQQKVMLIEVAKKGMLSLGGADLIYLSSFRADSPRSTETPGR